MRPARIFAAVLVVVLPTLAQPPDARAQDEDPVACADVAPVAFVATPPSFDFGIDVVADDQYGEEQVAAETSIPQLQPFPDEGNAGWVRATVNFTVEPECELPSALGVRLAYTVVMDGPGNSNQAPTIGAEQVAFDDIRMFGDQLHLLAAIDVSDIGPGQWSGTLPLEFLAYNESETSAIGTGLLPVEVKHQQKLCEGGLFSPLLLGIFGWLIGVLFGLFRMLAVSEEDLALKKLHWLTTRNFVALGAGFSAALTAWITTYMNTADFRLTLSSGLALVSAVAVAATAGFIAFYKPVQKPTEDEDSDDKAREDAQEPAHGTQTSTPQPPPPNVASTAPR